MWEKEKGQGSCGVLEMKKRKKKNKRHKRRELKRREIVLCFYHLIDSIFHKFVC